MSRRNRRPTNDNELKETRRLKLENQKLRKEVSSLRKQLSRIDLDRHHNIKEILEEEQQNTSNSSKNNLDELKHRWECHTCHNDYLRLTIVRRIDGIFYFRRCPACLYKTRLKKFTNDIEGIGNDNTVYNKN